MQQIIHRSVECERLVNAAHRFAKVSQNNPVKLFHLLYMLDIKHFREAGRSCTGETYYAMADGPAPGTLRSLLVMRDVGLDIGIGVLTSTDTQGPWPFDPKLYCQRSLSLLHELETAHRKTTLRELSLDDADAWWRVYTRCRGVGAAIPYEWTLPRGDGGGHAFKKDPSLWRPGQARIGDAGAPNHPP